jgi:hypothetical protein
MLSEANLAGTNSAELPIGNQVTFRGIRKERKKKDSIKVESHLSMHALSNHQALFENSSTRMQLKKGEADGENGFPLELPSRYT